MPDKKEAAFNREQNQAVRCDPDRPCLVIAGPGAGKTAVIAGRCRYLLQEAGAAPGSILVLTFTRAAAQEMRTRFIGSGSGPGDASFGTFHSVFFREIAGKYGLSSGNLVGESEKSRLIQSILLQLYPECAEDRILSEALQKFVLSGGREGENSPSVQALPGGFDPEAVYRKYREALRKSGKIDYDDILILTLEMLRTDEAALRRLKKQWKYLLVDEFQDVSPIQYEIVKALAGPENRVFAVGDDDQSIYGFRGAGPGLMLRFPKDFPESQTMKLRVNYRSSPEIVRASLRLISHNRARYEKDLRAHTEEKGNVEIRHFPTEKDAYEYAASALLRKSREKEELSESAVLFRTNAAISVCSSVFLDRGVPFILRDRVPNPYRHFSAVPLFALLNFSSGDERRENFLRFMNCPPRYIRRADLRSPRVQLSELEKMYLEDEDRSWMAERIRYLKYQIGLLQRLRLPYAMINYIRKGMELDEYFRDYALERGMDAEEIMKALDFIQDSSREYRTLSDWYAYIAAYTKALETKRDREESPKGKSLLSTIHGVKGLEFREVCVMDVTERSIPHEKAASPEELQEERRLLYVAMTRAKRKLSLFVPKSISGRKNEESRFLQEIRGSGVSEFRDLT